MVCMTLSRQSVHVHCMSVIMVKKVVDVVVNDTEIKDGATHKNAIKIKRQKNFTVLTN